MIIVWLIILDLCAKIENNTIGVLCGVLSLFGFLFFHAVLKKPDKWDFNRLSIRKPSYLLLLTVTTILLVLGDIFWIYHTKTSADILNSEKSSIVFLILAVLVYPVIEEFGFRLWLQSYIERLLHPIFAITLIAIGFGFVHRPDMPIPQILAGLFYGILLLKTKSIWIPILIHIIQNAVLILSGEIEFVQNISLELMDREGNSNLYIAILIWILSGILILTWWRLSKKRIEISK